MNTTASPSISRTIVYLCISIFIILSDQLSKWYITEKIFKPLMEAEPLSFLNWLSDAPERIGPIRIEILPFYNLVMVWNEGISFGMMNGIGNTGPIILIGLSLVIALILLIWMWRNPIPAQALCLALIIGGALGNVIDRARFGAVIDFIDLHAAGYHWPAFNIADSAIVIGIGFLIIHSLFFEKKSP